MYTIVTYMYIYNVVTAVLYMYISHFVTRGNCIAKEAKITLYFKIKSDPIRKWSVYLLKF